MNELQQVIFYNEMIYGSGDLDQAFALALSFETEEGSGDAAPQEYVHRYDGTRLTLVLRASTANDGEWAIWELRDEAGEWIGIADYLPILTRKLERKGYAVVS